MIKIQAAHAKKTTTESTMIEKLDALLENLETPANLDSSPGQMIRTPSLSQPSFEPLEDDCKLSEDNDKLDIEQHQAIYAMQGRQNVFLSGMAGTGKSTTLLKFVSQSFKKVDICATTGIAALNLQNQFLERSGLPLTVRTIYSWAGIGLGPAHYQSIEDYFNWLSLPKNMTRSRQGAFQRIHSCEALVIDEISMLPGKILNLIDFIAKNIRGNDRPFGGIQVIFVGDFLQLPPVAKDGHYDWAFQSPAWKNAGFRNVYLQTIHRQDEPLFVQALNNFREGRISQEVANVLATRVKRFVDRKVIHLMTHNAQVDKWNAYQIGEINSPETIFEAEFNGNDYEIDFLKKNSITPIVLRLKVGARVMVTRNITEEGELIAVNGQCGTVTDLLHNSVVIELDNGDVCPLEYHKWQFDPQKEDSATMHQIPLRPAYALTIHKSQGLTLDKAYIDIRAAREPGQAYVALSRLKSLQGLYLKDWIKGIFISDTAINFYRSLRK